jgi:hypothetical protein
MAGGAPGDLVTNPHPGDRFLQGGHVPSLRRVANLRLKIRKSYGNKKEIWLILNVRSVNITEIPLDFNAELRIDAQKPVDIRRQPSVSRMRSTPRLRTSATHGAC